MTSTRSSASTTTRTEEDSAALAANSTPLIKGIKENIPKKQPVATQTEADNARDRHDYFNLIALPFIVASSLINYNIDVWNLSITFHGDYFYLNWSLTLLYFLTDLVWVARVPICVKSPGVIVKHHIAAMFYLMGPFFWPEYQCFVGSILSVEVNTFFLIARRVVFKASSPIPPLVQQFVSTMFYTTWIWIRCYIYPYMFVIFLFMASDRIQATNRYWHWEMIFIVAHAVLCVLNVKWTYDLFKPIVERWLGNGPKGVATIQSGL